MTRSRKKLLAILIIILMLLSAVLVLLTLLPSSSSEDDVAKETALPTNDTANTASENGFEQKVESGSGTLPELNWEGRIPASGEFDLKSIPNDLDLDLDANAADYAAIIAAIKSADADFDPKGYMVRAHILSETSMHGSVYVRLYVQDIETSSRYTVIVDSGQIEYVFINLAYHPTPEKLNQIAQLKSDFETSSAGQREIERVKASLWPSAEGTELFEYTEEYYFDFATDRLWLYVNDKRWVGEYELRRIEPRYGSIDCLEVLANG